mgnify:CR=1 FL=1
MWPGVSGGTPPCKLLQRKTPNSILNKSVQFRVQTWLRQIDNTSIVVDSLAVMVLYSVQVRATSFSSSLERPYCLQNSDQPSEILAVESMNGIRHSES